ncbi:MAG: tetratricopeptide repeat protein [Planctomycetota bacterium]
MTTFILLVLLLGGDPPFVTRRLGAADALLAQGKKLEARDLLRRALEGDRQNAHVLHRLAQLCLDLGQTDEAVYLLNRLAQTLAADGQMTREQAAPFQPLLAKLKSLDPMVQKRDAARQLFRENLLKLGRDHLAKKRYHSALAVFQELLTIDPHDRGASDGMKQVRREGGNELAAQGVAGGDDLLAGVTPQWLEQNDRLHQQWENAWEKKTKNYSVQTNAGYEVLQTVAAAMEQLNHFYRIFHQYKTDGSDTPHLAVKIYRTHDEYRTRGKPDQEWAGGHFDGTSVQTWDYREGAKGPLDSLLQTLAHEASHQFVALACGAVPAWLNEGLASFFEGTQYLSNGQIKWNLVAAGRLLPLAESLEKSPVALADVLSGKVDDYRVYYPYGWGIVYYLYNAEDEHGELLYRALLNEYAKTYPGGADAVERFTDFFVTRPRRGSAASFADLEHDWRRWILHLRDVFLGKVPVANEYEGLADQLLLAQHVERALEKYELALDYEPDRASVVFKVAQLLERTGELDRATGMYRRFLRLAEFQELLGDPRVSEAERRVAALDPLHEAASRRRAELDRNLLGIAREYRSANLPTMALATVRDLVVSDTPNGEARDFYLDVEEASGTSLEEWQAIGNEVDLSGFITENVAENYQVRDAVIAGHVLEAPEASAPHTGQGPRRNRTQVLFKMLQADRRVAGDYSLEAELRAGAVCQLVGLVFGSKGSRAGNDPGAQVVEFFHAALVKADGSVDISSYEGDAWRLRGNAALPVNRREWLTLRADIADDRLALFVNGSLLKEVRFKTREELRGRFGILVGGGDAEFRNVRLLERDARLPPKRSARAVAEHDLTEQPITLEKPPRARAGLDHYVGAAPPQLKPARFFNSEPFTLDDLLGKVVVLGFMQIDQEQGIPSLPAYQKIAETYATLDVVVVLVVSDKGSLVEKFLKEKGVKLPVVQDAGHQTILDYNLISIPHAKLLDMDGRVVWEGNPDWRPGEDSYIDAPLAELAEKRGLKLIAQAPTLLEQAAGELAAGNPFKAAELLRPLTTIDAPHPVVQEARLLMQDARHDTASLLELVQKRVTDGRLRSAEDLLNRILRTFPRLEGAVALRKQLKQGELLDAAKQAARAWADLEGLTAFLERGNAKAAARRLAELDTQHLAPDEQRLASALAALLGGEAARSNSGQAIQWIKTFAVFDRIEELVRVSALDTAKETLSDCRNLFAGTPLEQVVDRLREELLRASQ